jgi:hypothetical protein
MDTLDKLQSFYSYKILLLDSAHLHFSLSCYDSLLEELVSKDIISNSERYQVFSYPLCSVFNGLHRWWRLFQVLRDNGKILIFLRFLRTKSATNTGLVEALDLYQKKFAEIEHLQSLVF